MVIDPHAEIRRLRTALRDLVALSTIPAVWVGREPPAIAAGLADVLVRSLYLDFAFVRLCDPKGGTAVEAARGNAWKAFPEWLQRHLAVVGQLSRKEIITDVGGGAEPCRGIVIPIGVDGEGGLLAAACDRSDFPTEIDQLLLSVASNHAATAFQSARLVHERRTAEAALRESEQELRQARNELAMKVAERTAALRRSEGYLAEAQRLTHTGSWARNLRTGEAFWSQEMFRMFGYDPGTQITFEKIKQERVHPEDLALFVQTGETAIREKKDLELEHRVVLPDGSIRIHHIVAHPVVNPSGEVVEIMGTTADVTERKRAEEEREALLASERGARAEAVTAQHRFRDLVNSVDGIVWEADAETFVFSFVSEQAERILGYPIERWLNEPTFWKDHLHPDDRGWAVDFCMKATAEKRDHDFEYRMIAADGHIVWLRDLVTVVVEGDRTASLRGVMVDITERKRAEEEHQAHLWFFESMDRVNRAILGTNDLEQMMSDVLDAVLSLFKCDRAWLVYPCDPEAASWRASMERTRPEFPGAFALGRDIPMDAEVAKVFQMVRDSINPVRFGPGPEHPVPSELAKRFSVQSIIGMAIYPKVDKPYMFGLHQCSYPRVWTPQEERLFQEIARRLADALTSLLMLRNLRESEAKLEEAQRIAHVGYWGRDLDTDRLTWSDETYRIFGLPQERTFTFAEYQELIHPDDRPVVIRAVEQALCGSPRYDVEYRVIRPDGEVRIVHSRGDVTRDESGRPRRAFGTVQDITERKRAEEGRREAEYLTEQVFESSPDGVSIIGRDYRYQRVNPIYERTWGRPAERIVGMHAADLLGMEVFVQKVKPNLDRCFAGEDVHYGEWFVSPLGRRYMAVSYSPLRPDSERVEAALMIFRDLTEHMLASEALQKAQADLAHISRVTTMGELTASLAHEINQPITAAVTNANTCLRWLARDQPDVEEARAAAARIVKDATRAANIISRIRLLFKKGAPERELVDINDVIREMIVLLRNEATRYAISIRTELAEDLPKVLADRVQLQQVLMNLMLNGIDAMKDVKPAGELTIKSQQDGSGQLLISVSDTGVGLPPEQADQIFNAFFTTKAHGTGMGLPISRSIVESHGGRLWATTNSGRGATFQFTLPGEVEAPK